MKKQKKAAALSYDPERDRAPKVLAKGKGKIAEKIIEIAKEYGIPIVENENLVDSLVKLDLLDEIPQELYKAVAEILAFIYTMKGKWEKEMEI